jgi:hypothetical protein
VGLAAPFPETPTTIALDEKSVRYGDGGQGKSPLYDLADAVFDIDSEYDFDANLCDLSRNFVNHSLRPRDPCNW